MKLAYRKLPYYFQLATDCIKLEFRQASFLDDREEQFILFSKKYERANISHSVIFGHMTLVSNI